MRQKKQDRRRPLASGGFLSANNKLANDDLQAVIMPVIIVLMPVPMAAVAEILAVAALPFFAAALFNAADFLLAAELCLPELLLPEFFAAAVIAPRVAVISIVAEMLGDDCILTDLQRMGKAGRGGGFDGAEQAGGENGADREYSDNIMLRFHVLGSL